MNENSLLRNTISLREHYLYTGTGEIMETKLKRISEISRQNPKEVFTSIFHLINKEMLRNCHDALKRLNAIIQYGYTSYVLDAGIGKCQTVHTYQV